MSDVYEQASNGAASEIVNAFKALRQEGVPPKRALELAPIKARQDAEESGHEGNETLSVTAGGIATSSLYDFLRSVWLFLTANANGPSANESSIGTAADARFRELMLLSSRNPRDRIHADVKGESGSLRIDLLNHESDFVIKDWLWNFLKAFRQETGDAAMPPDGLARLNDALEVGFSLSSMWGAWCWSLHLVFNDVGKTSGETMAGILGLLSTNPHRENRETRPPHGGRTCRWEPTAARTVTRQAESYDGIVEVAVYIEDLAGRMSTLNAGN